ncbi:MAG: cytochrome c biogenesis protein [Actinomycetota bacterium]
MSSRVDEATAGAGDGRDVGRQTATRWRRRALGFGTLVGLGVLVWAAFAYAPQDIKQGPSQRIFYIHVPSAWIAFLAFAVVFGASIAFLATRNHRWDQVAVSSAEIGTVFTTAVLVTGPLWARPVWGVYWSWDPRLTSVLVLWLIYLSYLALRGYVVEPDRRARFSAVLGIVGFLDVPIVYLSVRWWRALHPNYVVLARGGPQMPGAMLATLMIGIAAFTLLYLYLMALRLRVERLRANDLEERP